MPVILHLRFPAGRYHATPWGRHVNEGVHEWPPSPWRILRALIAVWRRSCPELPEPLVRRVLEVLVQPPKFSLPKHRVAHTRHYMPWEKKGPADRTLVFDTFVAVDRRDCLRIGWLEAVLSAEEEDCLRRLVANLSYLGRAEGWVEAKLVTSEECNDRPWDCVPSTVEDAGKEMVSVFCPDPETAFTDEYYPPPPDAKKLKRGLKPDEYHFDCPRWHICMDTETLHAERWPRMPGARWVSYVRPTEVVSPIPRAPRQEKQRQSPQVARFILDGPVLPQVLDTVLVAEAIRTTLLGLYKRVVLLKAGHRDGGNVPPHINTWSRTLSGKEGGMAVTGSHGHAYYLPMDEDEDGRIDHVTIVATDGFSSDEVAALNRLRKLTLHEADWQLQLVGLGQPAEFRTPLFRPSKEWVSGTPFIVSRHLKTRGQKRDPEVCRGVDGRRLFAELVLSEELGRWIASRPQSQINHPQIEPVRMVPGANGRETPLQAFRRARERKPGDDGYRRPAGAFRLVFLEPVVGPICLGHLSHFGMGMFLPCQPNPGRDGDPPPM